MSERRVDVVIPVYNEGANIRRVVESLARGMKTPHRVLICHDTDDDDTLPVARELAAEGHDIRCVKNPGRGPHAAVLAGFAASTAPAVLMFPADDDYNAERLDALVGQVLDGADIACASRFIPGGRMEGCPWLKAVLVRGAAFSLYHLARVPTHDSTNGFRCFSRRVLDTVAVESTEGFTYSIELLVKAHRLGWPIAESPVHWYERGAGQGQSRFKVLKWLPAYLRWYAYAFATTWAFRGPGTVRLKT